MPEGDIIAANGLNHVSSSVAVLLGDG